MSEYELAQRIARLEAELLRLQAVVSVEDYELIQEVLDDANSEDAD
jgi:hypothetical protein